MILDNFRKYIVVGCLSSSPFIITRFEVFGVLQPSRSKSISVDSVLFLLFPVFSVVMGLHGSPLNNYQMQFSPVFLVLVCQYHCQHH